MSVPNKCNTFSCLMNQYMLATFDECQDNLVSKQTIKYRMLANILEELELTFGHMCHVINTHTPVHPEVADIIKPLCAKQEYYQTIMAQDFIENEKLVKIAKHLCKNDHTSTVHSLLAMDGMNGHKLNHGPNVDIKRYVENLKFGLSGQVGLYDREKSDDVKRAHVYAIRKVYSVLPEAARRVNNVYHVVKTALQEYTGSERIYGDNNVVHNLDEETLHACVETYTDNMNKIHLKEMMKLLKNKIVQPITESDEDEESKKKRSVDVGDLCEMNAEELNSTTYKRDDDEPRKKQRKVETGVLQK